MAITHVNGPLPGPKSRELLERWYKYEADVVGFQAPLVWDSASGCVVKDVDGNTYIDWTSGVLVTNVGHCHPHLVKSTQEATGKLLNNYECANEYRILAAERLVQALPSHLDQCFFLSTGSETIEAANRLMKRKTGNFEIVSFEGGFHGRTTSAASMGGMPGPKHKYGPTQPGVIRMPFPNPYRDPYEWCKEGPDYKSYFDHLDAILMANSTGSLAGVIVEPYQGAAGFIFPPDGWLTRLEEWTREKGMLFTLDEVQSSYGRTGKMWALEHESLTPDIVTIGKGIGSGVAVSAIAARSEVFSCLRKGEMSSTLGGNPVASAAVIAVLDIMDKENLAVRSVAQGDYLKARLCELADRCDYLGDVRGKGLVMGLEFVKDKRSKEPSPELTKQVIEQCANHGLLVGAVGMFGNVIRVAPPLVITREEIDESVEIMDRVLQGLTI
jgi:4-aminobutyrate aminotransferase-like enzyme